MNNTELREEMIDTFNKLKNDEISLDKAKRLSISIGRVLQSAKLQLQYNIYIQSDKRIKFLEDGQ